MRGSSGGRPCEGAERIWNVSEELKLQLLLDLRRQVGQEFLVDGDVGFEQGIIVIQRQETELRRKKVRCTERYPLFPRRDDDHILYRFVLGASARVGYAKA